MRLFLLCVLLGIFNHFTLKFYSTAFCKTVFVDRHCFNLFYCSVFFFQILWLKVLLVIIVWIGISSFLQFIENLSSFFWILKFPLWCQWYANEFGFTQYVFTLQLLMFFLWSINLVFWLLCFLEKFFPDPVWFMSVYFLYLDRNILL